jgi:hypothetical protein
MGRLGGLLGWCKCAEMSFLLKNVLVTKKTTHFTGCSLAGVICDSSVSVQFKTICDV